MGNLNQKRRCSSLHEYFQGTVGERIQDLLREKKMTQAVLAQRTQDEAQALLQAFSQFEKKEE